MAGERTKLVVVARESLGSRETRRLRKQGQIPGVLYGADAPVAFAVAERELRRALTGAGGLHSILDVEIDGHGKTHASILKEYQLDKVRGHITHVDLLEVRLDKPIHAAVAVHLVGGENAPGVREGGVLAQPVRELNIEALPLEVPEHLDLDVSHLGIGDVLRIADLAIPAGVTVLDDGETIVATVTAQSRAVEEEAPAEGEAAEGAEAPEAEAGAEAPGEPAADAEPDTAEG
jgi:large subunit ribosomal protein L25